MSDDDRFRALWDSREVMTTYNGYLEKFKVSLQNKEAPLCPCA